jgi:hypothetical protein
MSRDSTPATIATIGIDIGKNSFHLVGLDRRGAIVLQLKLSRFRHSAAAANGCRRALDPEACTRWRRCK